MRVDGKVYINDDIIRLGDNDRLLVKTGLAPKIVYADSSSDNPSIIQSHGSFDGRIVVSDEKELIVRLYGPLSQSVTLRPSTASTRSQITLESDLVFTDTQESPMLVVPVLHRLILLDIAFHLESLLI